MRVTDRHGKTIQVEEVAHHRNGICGAGFYAVTFTERDGGQDRRMVGVVFDFSPYPDEREEVPELAGSPRVAVLERNLLADGIVTFGENSWRGDQYQAVLHQAIEESERVVA